MLAGSVVVDGEVVTRLGTKVDPRTAVIRVDGKRLPPISAHVYLALNKPRGVVSTMSDPEGRRTLSDVVADRPERLFHVGRLDTDTAGLIILTNDGDSRSGSRTRRTKSTRPTSPRSTGEVTKAALRRLADSVTLDDGQVTVSRTRIVRRGTGKTIVKLVIHEGRNKIVRRLLGHVGHPVRRLTRTRIGPVELGPRSAASSATHPGRAGCCWTAPSSDLDKSRRRSARGWHPGERGREGLATIGRMAAVPAILGPVRHLPGGVRRRGWARPGCTGGCRRRA